MSKFQDFFPGENILSEEQGFYVKGFLNAKTGTIVMTDKRVAFVEQKMVPGGGLLVAAAVEISGVKRPKLKVDVPFEEMDSWEHPKKHDIRIKNKNGEQFTLRPVKYDVWDEKLKELKK